MHFQHPIARISPIAGCAVLAATAAFINGNSVALAQTNQQESAQQLVREVVWNEIDAQNSKPVYWRYLETDTNDGAKKVFDVCETKAGTVKQLVSVNGGPPSPAQRRQQNARIQRMLNDPSVARKAAQASRQDGEGEQRLLAMLPNAFLFQYNGSVGDLVRLAFRPNPRFNPPTREAEVFHHMEGHLLVDPHQKRLAEIDGRLMTQVKFWWGLLGYLQKGGTFLVRQAEVGGKHWKMTRLSVNMNGKALFFKTIGVQENERFEAYREIPPDTTLRQAVERLEKGTPPS